MEPEKVNEFKNKMLECLSNGDIEIAHCEADDILCDMLEELGYEEITEIYHRIDKWYV